MVTLIGPSLLVITKGPLSSVRCYFYRVVLEGDLASFSMKQQESCQDALDQNWFVNGGSKG